MENRRQVIAEAGLAVLREHGYTGFTQPRVAARAGLRQSHITYYHPTRLDLLVAVGRAAVDRQLAAVDATLNALTSLDEMANVVAGLVSREENTRVLMALAQAGDEEPRLRALFQEMAGGIRTRVAACLSRLTGMEPREDLAFFLHAVSVGLSVIHLATGTPDGQQQAAAMIRLALQTIVQNAAPASSGAPITSDA